MGVGRSHLPDFQSNFSLQMLGEVYAYKPTVELWLHGNLISTQNNVHVTADVISCVFSFFSSFIFVFTITLFSILAKDLASLCLF